VRFRLEEGEIDLDAKSLIDAIHEADFETLMDDKVDNFLNFVREILSVGENDVVVRMSLESDEDESFYPFYIWVVYSILTQDEYLGLRAKEIFIPREEELSSYYEAPRNLKGRKFFPIVIE